MKNFLTFGLLVLGISTQVFALKDEEVEVRFIPAKENFGSYEPKDIGVYVVFYPNHTMETPVASCSLTPGNPTAILSLKGCSHAIGRIRPFEISLGVDLIGEQLDKFWLEGTIERFEIGSRHLEIRCEALFKDPLQYIPCVTFTARKNAVVAEE